MRALILAGATDPTRRYSTRTGPDGALLHLSSLLMAAPDTQHHSAYRCTRLSAILIR